MQFDDDDQAPEALQKGLGTRIAELLELGRTADGGRTAREMLEKIPNARHLILAAAFRCLDAQKFYHDKAAGGMVHEPDYKTQLDATKLLLSYLDGLPVETQLQLHVPSTGAKAFDLEAAARKSPALRERLAQIAALPAAKPE